MKPNDDPQLRELLREWKTPDISGTLEARVVRPHRSWSRFLLHGYIRVPMPVVYGLIVLLMFAGWRMSERAAQPAPCVAACNHAVAGAC